MIRGKFSKGRRNGSKPLIPAITAQTVYAKINKSTPTTAAVSTTGMKATQGAISVWVDIDATRRASASVGAIFSHRGANTSSNNCVIMYFSANNLTAYLCDGSGVASTWFVPINAFSGITLLGMQWDSSEASLWINGIKQAGAAANPHIPAALYTDFKVGYDAQAGWASGLIEYDCRAYNRPLTTNEWFKLFIMSKVRVSDVAATTNISTWGDSLTANTYQTALSTALGGRTVNAFGIGGDGPHQILTRMKASTTYCGDITVIWSGRNGINTSTGVAQAKADIQAGIDWLSTNNRRYVVLTVLNGNSAADPSTTWNEYTGSGIYENILALNAWIVATYPSNSIDIRSYLISQHNSTTQDLNDIAHDTVPTSLRVDNIHLNATGYGLVATQLANFITARNW